MAEIGRARTKNTGNIIVKSLVDFLGNSPCPVIDLPRVRCVNVFPPDAHCSRCGHDLFHC